MCRVLTAVSILLWIIILTTHSAVGIVNRKKNTSSQYPPGFYPRREYLKYLDTNRPLWVLQDKVNRPDEIGIAFPSKRRSISPVVFTPKLPSHYLNLGSSASLQPMPSNQKPPPNHRAFPVFDDFETYSEPIFIYRGATAKMIFNTMMTTRQYPMKEPVPGQVMYPPYSPKFKSTPVVEERVRPTNSPESAVRNVTMIPFYAHEAIYPRKLLYETNQLTDELEGNDLADNNHQEPTRYHSYYSQDDLQTKYWSMPPTTLPPPEPLTSMSLNRQLPVPNGLHPNHRMEITTPMPRPPDDSFRIMYDSELENQSPKRVHIAKYGGFKTMYPIFTLNKLLKHNPHKQNASRRSINKDWRNWNPRQKAINSSNHQTSSIPKS